VSLALRCAEGLYAYTVALLLMGDRLFSNGEQSISWRQLQVLATTAATGTLDDIVKMSQS